MEQAINYISNELKLKFGADSVKIDVEDVTEKEYILTATLKFGKNSKVKKRRIPKDTFQYSNYSELNSVINAILQAPDVEKYKTKKEDKDED